MTGAIKTAAVLTGLILLGWAGWSFATGWHPSTKRYPLQGVDLAENPGPVEWGTVRAGGADFAYLVATVGANRRDPAFEGNWTVLPEAGLRRGAIHLYSMCQRGDGQANAFNTFVPRTDDALPAAVDIAFRDDCPTPPSRAVLVAELTQFVTMVETHTGKPMLLRIAKPVEATYQLSAALARPLWSIRDVVAPAYAARPWTLWRASDFRRVDGIDGPVNWDVVAP